MRGLKVFFMSINICTLFLSLTMVLPKFFLSIKEFIFKDGRKIYGEFYDEI